MAKTDLNITSLGSKFVDLRDTIPGDSYNWSWARLLSEVTFLAIHHTGGSDDQTPQEIAIYHIASNSWGGIGYHFLVDKTGIVYYVGDISTARANVANLNEQVIGICFIGNFLGNAEPTVEQLDSAHKLCDFLITQCPDLINIKSWDCVKGHKELPDQTTNCPGDNWNLWKVKLINGNIMPNQTGRIVFNAIPDPKTQIESLQLSLATVNSKLISYQEALQQAQKSQVKEVVTQRDQTLTLIDALVNLYKFILPGKSEA